MYQRSYLRDRYKQFGPCYVTAIDDVTHIPWKPLSMGDFIHYEEAFLEGDVLPAILENEIFNKCVLDNDYKTDIDILPAGLVTAVVQNIMQISGPTGIDAFNQSLDEARLVSQKPLHYLVTIIARAFPAYKLEDIYSMPYDIFLLRLSQAERYLIEIGFLKDAISLMDENKPKKKHINSPELKAIWEQQQREQEPIKEKPIFKPLKHEPSQKIDSAQSPLFDPQGKIRKQKNLDWDRVDMENAAGSFDENELRAKMLEESQFIYGDLLDKMPVVETTGKQKKNKKK